MINTSKTAAAIEADWGRARLLVAMGGPGPGTRSFGIRKFNLS
jgi:hypothetical protein